MNIDIQQVSVQIQNRHIIENITLHVPSGQMVGLVGPNGSGKSTLLRTIYRLLKPQTGYVRVGGADVWKLSARASAQRTGVVVQETPNDFQFTVGEVVQMGRTPHKSAFEADTPHDAALVMQALQRVEMQGFETRMFSTLSGGEKQRVLIARVLAQHPHLLLLDEPTNHLDIHHQLEVLELVRGLGLTTLVTLHDLNLAAMYCSYLYVMQAGQIVAEGTPEDTLTQALIQQVFRVDVAITRHPIQGCLQLMFAPLPAQNPLVVPPFAPPSA